MHNDVQPKAEPSLTGWGSIKTKDIDKCRAPLRTASRGCKGLLSSLAMKAIFQFQPCETSKNKPCGMSSVFVIVPHALDNLDTNIFHNIHNADTRRRRRSRRTTQKQKKQKKHRRPQNSCLVMSNLSFARDWVWSCHFLNYAQPVAQCELCQDWRDPCLWEQRRPRHSLHVMHSFRVLSCIHPSIFLSELAVSLSLFVCQL